MKKLIRTKFAETLQPHEVGREYNIDELKRLYVLKMKEEMNEIIDSDFKDINEYADLIQVIIDLANLNNIYRPDIEAARAFKYNERGGFDNTILLKLNPTNPSNKVYVDDEESNHKFHTV